MKGLWVAALALMITSTVFGQGFDFGGDDLFKEKERSQELLQRKPTSLTNVVFEQPVNPAEFIVGPGDQFQINIWGQINEFFPVDVLPEGNVIIPSVGEVYVAGKTLKEAKSAISAKGALMYPNAEVTANLLNVRNFYIHVSGAVNYPGSYEVNASQRASSVLNTFFREQTSYRPMLPGQAARRNIKIFRRLGPNSIIDTLFVDLDGKDLGGLLESDPLLYNGDVIQVPARNDTIEVLGEVNFPRSFDFVPGDRLSDVIRLAGGVKSSALIEEVEIIRFKPDRKSVYTFKADLSAISSGKAQDFKMAPFDVVSVKRDNSYLESNYVTLAGEVAVPGVYRIQPDSTTLVSAIRAAGGFSELFSLNSSYVIRRTGRTNRDIEFLRLKETQLSAMTELEAGYFRSKYREKDGLVRVDFSKLFNADGSVANAAADLKLVHQDSIVIGRRNNTVKVLGGVSFPGLIEFSEGKGYRYYVKQAGGFKDRARKGEVQIISAGSNTWADAKKSLDVQPGDVVFVPEKTIETEKQDLKDLIQIIANVSSTVAVILSILITTGVISTR